MTTYFVVLFGVKNSVGFVKFENYFSVHTLEVEKDTDNFFALLILVTFFIVKCNTAVLRDIFQLPKVQGN